MNPRLREDLRMAAEAAANVTSAPDLKTLVGAVLVVNEGLATANANALKAKELAAEATRAAQTALAVADAVTQVSAEMAFVAKAWSNAKTTADDVLKAAAGKP